MVGVTVRDLVVRYGAGAGPAAVDGVGLSIEPQEMFLLVGPSGCGKTTVLRSIAGFVRPNAGSIHFGAEDVTQLPAHARNAGMVFQSFALWPHMTVAQNVGFGLREKRVAKGEIATRVEAALESTQMKGFGPRRIDQLSGGEQQRVALARALVVRPRCLLLDEPLASLDAKLRRSMREEIRRICKSFGLTAIYVTHDQKEALAIADRVAVMDRGRILQVGTPEDVYRRPQSRAVAAFVGDTNLLEGRVTSSDASVVRIDSALGPLIATAAMVANAANGAAPGSRADQSGRVGVSGSAPSAGTKVWISIRPECCRLVPCTPEPSVRTDVNRDNRDNRVNRVNRLKGRLTATVYLGEMAEHRLQIGEHGLSVFELNPRRAGSNAEMTVEIDAADVVLLPFDPTERTSTEPP